MQGAVKLDPWLSPFEGVLKRRFSSAQKWIDHLQQTEGGLDKFSKVRKITVEAVSTSMKLPAPEHAINNTDGSRVLRDLASTLTLEIMSYTGNGPPMLRRLISLAISVRMKPWILFK